AYLVVILAPELAAESKRVLTPDPREVIDELESAVVVRVRPFGIVTEPAVAYQRNIGNAPLHGFAGLQPRDADFAHHVFRKGEVGARRIEESRVAEPGLVDFRCRKDPRIGDHVLLEIRNGFRPVQGDTGIGLVFIAPAITGGPLRVRRLHEIHPGDELILVDRGVAHALVVAGD